MKLLAGVERKMTGEKEKEIEASRAPERNNPG